MRKALINYGIGAVAGGVAGLGVGLIFKKIILNKLKNEEILAFAFMSDREDEDEIDEDMDSKYIENEDTQSSISSDCDEHKDKSDTRECEDSQDESEHKDTKVHNTKAAKKKTPPAKKGQKSENLDNL